MGWEGDGKSYTLRLPRKWNDICCAEVLVMRKILLCVSPPEIVIRVGSRGRNTSSVMRIGCDSQRGNTFCACYARI